MRVLFLDDDKVRHDSFAEAVKGIENGDVWHVYSASQAIHTLEKDPKYDLVCLDHDLGSGAGNGSDVAKYISTMPEDKRPERVILHTFQREGMVNMSSFLRPVGIWHRWMVFGPYFLDSVKSLMEMA